MRGALAVAAILAVLAVGCGGETLDEQPNIAAPRSIMVTSDFESGGSIPRQFTCDGADESPPLQWSPAANARGYALIMTDPDAPSGTFVHWVVFGIPPSVTTIEHGSSPEGALQGTNSFGDEGYGGPCPPEGDDPHRYEFTIYALDEEISDRLEPGAGAEEVLAAIECCVTAQGTLSATYGR